MGQIENLELMSPVLWAFATGTGLLIIFLAFFMILFYKKRLQSLSPLNKDVGDLINQKERLKIDVDSIKEWIASQKDEILRLEGERKEQEIIRSEIQRLEQEATQKEEENKKLRDEVGNLENQQHMLVQSMEKLEKEKLEIKKEIETRGQEAEKSNKELSKIEEDLKSLINEKTKVEELIKESNEKLKSIENESKTIDESISKKVKEVEDLERLIRVKEKELKDLEETQNKLIADKERELKNLEKSFNEKEKDKIELETEVRTLSDKLKTVGQMPKEAFDHLNVPFIKKIGFTKDENNEEQALNELYDLTLKRGFELPERLQNAFHTSLKTSDISCLTVMAGVSGTGKSAFPKLYAESVGIHFLPLAVEPRWDSPQDLFGFLNYMENRFESTTLGRSLVQFDNSPFQSKNANLNNQLLLVLLDEMNLARVEYYFSEFLSKLEMRRNSDVTKESDYRMVSTEIYAGSNGVENGKEANDPIYLYAGSNVLFVGTMNEDETTQSLSDKVIDRANVLHFGKPEKLKAHQQNVTSTNNWAPITTDTWNKWIVSIDENNVSKYSEIEEKLNDINGTLSSLGRPFGWRTYKAIMSYIINHPDVKIKKENGILPLSDQIAMRVMPKLKGLDLGEHEEIFNRLSNQISNVGDDVLTEAFQKARNNSMGFFDWRGINW
jgi:predicted  nucleic acid-binding Zn-ribbon protein